MRMRVFLQIGFVMLSAVSAMALDPSGSPVRTALKVKEVSEGNVYLDGGRNAGLVEGTVLLVRRTKTFEAGNGDVKASVIIAKIAVVSLSATSAMCEVRSRNGQVRPGDLAFISMDEQPRPAPRPRRDGRQAVGAAAFQSSAQETRSTVFKPLMAGIGNEDQDRTPPPANKPVSPAALGAAPISIAEAARLYRRKKPEPATASTVTAPAPASAPPPPGTQSAAATPNPAVSAGKMTSTAPPLSLAEIARENRAREARTVVAEAHPANSTSALNSPPVARVMAQKTQAAQPATAPAPQIAAAASVPAHREVSAASEQAQSAQRRAAIVTAKPVVAAGTPAPTPNSSPAAAAATPVTAAAAVLPAPREAINSSAPAVVAPAKVASELPVSSPAAEPASTPDTTDAATAMLTGGAVDANVKTVFNVKYVADDAIYIDGGKSAGLEEGMTLTVKKADTQIAELSVISVSNTSAVCSVKTRTADIQRGDVALLSQADQEKLVQLRTLGPNRKYPMVIAFSEGDPLDEEVRAAVPKAPLPEINRARGRLGLDYTFVTGPNTPANNAQLGGVVRIDMTRIGGSYWNLNGYWRGRLNMLSSSSTTQPQSVFDLVNRTYTIGFTYVNPNSHWTAGVGRLYLPWAASLDTIDGGYFGRKFGSHATIGAFAGTTPDPTSFDYNPDRRQAGAFLALEGGSFDHFRFTSTEGVAVSSILWNEDRQYIFSENGLFYKTFISIYHSMQVDSQRLPTGGKTQGLSRSFATLRIQPFSRLSFDVNHNYFRDVPTFDPTLVGTGLLDKFLFQGISVGSRLELPGHISIYNNFGQSSRSGDPTHSINQLYGLTLGRLWFTGIRADLRYSKFDSSFGQGDYRAISLSRNFSDVLRLEVNAGKQNFLSSLSTPTNYKLLGATVDLNFGGHYFVESSLNLQRSVQQSFNQWLMTVGYRFDSGRHRQ